MVDYTSRSLVVHKLHSMTAQHVASHFKSIFSEYGWLDTLVSDNGPCYTAEAFTNLTQEYTINYITSSLHSPQSNGLAEKFVQIVKNLFYKAKEEGMDLYKSLMIYHNPHYQAICNHQYRCYKAGLPDHNFPCQMQPEDSLVYLQNNLESRPRMNICLHMSCV